MQQDREVADLLRDLMGRHCDRGDDAEMDVGEKGRADQHAVDQVVDGVADEDEGAGGRLRRVPPLTVPVHLAVGLVAMPPEHQLLEQEEPQYAEEDGAGDPMQVGHARPRQGMRQQREEGGAQQGTDGEAHEVRQQAIPQRLREGQEGRCGQHAERPAQQAEQQDPGQKGHRGRGLHSGGTGDDNGRRCRGPDMRRRADQGRAYRRHTSVAMRPVVPSRR